MDYKLRNVAGIFLSVVIISAILCTLALYYWHLDLRLHVLLAREQVNVFAAMREKALASNISQATESLEYTMNYYPSGTKQVEGSPLDEIVETSRKMAIDDIIEFLRKKSGQDHGDDPKAWLEYQKKFQQERRDAE
jgi:hypothetical protein